MRVDKRYFRPTEVEELLGDSTKALKKLGWVSKITLEEIVEEMIKYDKEKALKELFLKRSDLTNKIISHNN